MGAKTDFQQELLQLNGILQQSITELKYRCEVYRLSFKSILKCIEKQQQESRLRVLITSRNNFQAYLLLSQKNALAKIWNVVRKASTFINGYSLIDKRLFQPPPPKPGCTLVKQNMHKKICSSLASNNNGNLPQSQEDTRATSASLQNESSCQHDGQLVTEANNVNAKTTSEGDAGGAARNKVRFLVTEDKGKPRWKKSRNRNHEASRKLPGRQDREQVTRRKTLDTDKVSRDKSTKLDRRSGGQERDERSRDSCGMKLNCDNRKRYGRVIKPHSTAASPASSSTSWTNRGRVQRTTTNKGRNDQGKRRVSTLQTSMKNKSSQSSVTGRRTEGQYGRKTSSCKRDMDREKLRDKVRRTGYSGCGSDGRASKNQNQERADRRGGGASGNCGSGSYRSEQDRRNLTRFNKERTTTTSQNQNRNQSRNKIRESLAIVRNRRNGTNTYTDRQGQGVTRKYLFSGSCTSRNNGFKLPLKSENVKRVRLQRGDEIENGMMAGSPRKNAK